MQIDGEEVTGIKLRPVPFSVETEETEMIAIDYVAKGGGNATAVTASPDDPVSPEASEKSEAKGKKRADKPEVEKLPAKDTTSILTVEDEDQIAALTTRLNSVRMLQSRLGLLSQFVKQQEPSYMTDASLPLSENSPNPESLSHLRNIQALIARLSLVTPADEESEGTLQPLLKTSEAQANDVQLSSLLALLGQDIQGISELGKKFKVAEDAKRDRERSKGRFQGNYGSMMDDAHIGALNSHTALGNSSLSNIIM